LEGGGGGAGGGEERDGEWRGWGGQGVEDKSRRYPGEKGGGRGREGGEGEEGGEEEGVEKKGEGGDGRRKGRWGGED